MRLQAVIFDFDGIVVDSEPLHHRAFSRVLEARHLPLSWERYYEHYLGFDDRDVLRTRFQEAGIPLPDDAMCALVDEKARVFVELINTEGVNAYPGVVSLIREAANRVPLAISSGALMSDISPILDLLDVRSCFADIVTADQVHVSKPDPESYREAFRRLAARHPGRVTDPARCFAIEDTPAGIAAAAGAGLPVLAVQNTYPAEALAQATRVVASLESVTPDLLDRLLPS
ncbi:MAG TPA: HAD family phosphatase [Kiritimatiellia bacterium]|nr:HAD family phosphatase [Kiritimatiellia bacterium]HMP00004.1 HAD family phosphatase [Kiritimatiellia bacterium]HMP98064.1 HAD family phosphatase [Kiritimatiellia bacterium]